MIGRMTAASAADDVALRGLKFRKLRFLMIANRISQRPQFAASNGVVGDGEIAPEHVEMLAGERGKARNIFWIHDCALGAEMTQSRVDITRVPQHQRVDDEAQCPQLVLLSFPVSLAQLAFLSMKHLTRQAVSAFVPVQLD
jgi:hypothetical protein